MAGRDVMRCRVVRRWGVAWAACVTAVAGLVACYNPQGGSLEIRELAAGERSLGIHVGADLKERLDYYAGYELSLVNDDPALGCNVALYFFDGEPERLDVPELTAGAVAPATLPGGGWLHYEWHLPAATSDGTAFSVSLRFEQLYPERGLERLETLDRGLVLATSGCPGLQLELVIWVESWGFAQGPVDFEDEEMRGAIRRLW